MFIGVHWCSLVFIGVPLVFIGVPLVFIGVPLVFIGVPLVWCFRLDPENLSVYCLKFNLIFLFVS